MFLDENTPDLRTIRRRYSLLGIDELLIDDGDMLMQVPPPPQLVQDFPDEIQFRLIVPAGGEDDETLNWTLGDDDGRNHRRRRRQLRLVEQEPRLQHAAVGTDDLENAQRSDTDDGAAQATDSNNRLELVIDEGVVALQPEHYVAGDMYGDYDGIDYDEDDWVEDEDDDDDDDRYTIDTFDLDDFHNIPHFRPESDMLLYEDYDGDGDDDDDDDDNDRDGIGNHVVVSSSIDGQSSPPWLYSGANSRSNSPVQATDANRTAWVAIDTDPEENWESDESIAALPNADHYGLVLEQEQQPQPQQQPQQQDQRTEPTTRSASGGADWPVSELGEDSERTIRLWSAVAHSVHESSSDTDTDLCDAQLE